MSIQQRLGLPAPPDSSPDPGHPPDRVVSANERSVGFADVRLARWLYLTASCLLLTALAFDTRPGHIIADTKIDMAVNPLGFLGRALHLWDPAQFGQLQNQAAGYFFPMGPFFVIGKLMALPAWVVQRLWMAAILIAAFIGVVRLAARLGIGTQGGQLVAGFAYALSPIALSLIGVNSGEFLPAAILPWILIPLVRMVREGAGMRVSDRVRAAAQSGVAVALCSGMNAASVLAMLLPAVLYLLTAERPARPWRILAYWVPAVVLACSSWLIPLLLLGRYGVSLLPYSESAQITTSVTSLSNILRGTEDWNAYLGVNGQPWWPVGFLVSSSAALTLLTGLTAGLGLTGLLSPRLPYRRFLLATLVLGILIVGAGYVSGLGNPLAASTDHLVNGVLAPLRNLHKFDPMIRLPVALGVAHLLATARVGRRRQAVSLVAAVGLISLVLPAAMTGFAMAGDFTSVPPYWIAATNWLNKHAGNQAVLAVPGAPFGEYIWGRPMDDVLEAMFTGDWASQQLASIGSPGEARLLIAINQRLAAGDGSAGLAQVLAQMGVRYIIVRNDLIYPDLAQGWPSRLHDALYASPGIVKVAQFGAFPVGSSNPDDAVSNFLGVFPPVEIFKVADARPVATVTPASDVLRVYGAPESILTLADQGLLKGDLTLLNSDSPGVSASAYVITDSLRRRIRNFGEVGFDYSPTLTGNDPATTFEAADDFLQPTWLSDEAVARYGGIANVTASSSSADIIALPGQSATGRLPFAALDGDRRTMWESGSTTGPIGQWLQVDFDRLLSPRGVRVAFADSVTVGPAVTKVAVATAAGTVTDVVRPTSGYQPLPVAAGPTGWLRITVLAVAGPSAPGEQAGIAEVSVPGVTASRAIVAPAVMIPRRVEPTVVLAKAEPQPSGCMLTSLRWVCSPSLVKPTEEQYGFDHAFEAAGTGRAVISGQAVLTDPAQVRRYAWPGKFEPNVTASSTYTGDPQDQPASAFDGNTATAWISGPTDRQPVLRIRWRGARKAVPGVTILRPPADSYPLQVLVEGSGGQLRGGVIGISGRLRFSSPLRTNGLTFVFTPAQLPLQISEVRIPGVFSLLPGSAKVTLRCGLGPVLVVNGKPVPTRAVGTNVDLTQGRPFSFSACSTVPVRAGANRVVEPARDPHGFDVQSVVLDPTGAGGLRARPRAQVSVATELTWGPTNRQIKVAANQRSFLVVAENFNAGWQASIDGKVLRPVTFDGWIQGWLLPAGTHGVVVLAYLPDALYRVAIFAGLGIVGLFIVISVVPLRRRSRQPVRSGESVQSAPSAAPPLSGQVATTTPSIQPFLRLRRVQGGAAPAAGLALRVLLAAAGLAGMSLLGIWLAGYPGAALAPFAAMLVGYAVARRRASRICALIGSPWAAGVALLVAAASSALGGQLQHFGSGGGAVTVLGDVAPQLLCSLIVIRLIAASVSPQD